MKLRSESSRRNVCRVAPEPAAVPALGGQRLGQPQHRRDQQRNSDRGQHDEHAPPRRDRQQLPADERREHRSDPRHHHQQREHTRGGGAAEQVSHDRSGDDHAGATERSPGSTGARSGFRSKARPRTPATPRCSRRARPAAAGAVRANRSAGRRAAGRRRARACNRSASTGRSTPTRRDRASTTAAPAGTCPSTAGRTPTGHPGSASTGDRDDAPGLGGGRAVAADSVMSTPQSGFTPRDRPRRPGRRGPRPRRSPYASRSCRGRHGAASSRRCACRRRASRARLDLNRAPLRHPLRRTRVA